MKRGLFLSTLMVALPVVAQAAPSPAPKPAAAAVPAPTQLPAGSRRVTLSAEGRAIASKVLGTPDPRATEIQTEMATIRQQKLQIVSAPTIDVDKLEPVLRKEETLQSEFRTRQNDRLLALLRALPAQDRSALVQTLVNPAKPANGAAPATAPAIPGN
jgi:uncharacterized membrane protein